MAQCFTQCKKESIRSGLSNIQGKTLQNKQQVKQTDKKNPTQLA